MALAQPKFDAIRATLMELDPEFANVPAHGISDYGGCTRKPKIWL